MRSRRKKPIKQVEHNFPIYAPFKAFLKSNGLDSGTAGQTAWLFVSFIIAGFFSIITLIVLFIFDVKTPLIQLNFDDIIAQFFVFTLAFHFVIVMLRLKYLIVNLIFLAVTYVGFITIDTSNILLLVCIGLSLFIIYILIPIYSWHIKILDGILYFLYALIGWFIVHG